MTAEYRVARISAASEAQLKQWFSEADGQRQAQILTKKRPLAQKQCLCADHLAREMLAAHGVLPVFLRSENGKPYLANAPLHFNLSHSGDFAACAVHAQPIGIDIETLREVSPALMQKVCTAQEQAFICTGGNFDHARFFQVWTAKEAYLKCLGCGLRGDLRQVEVIQHGSFAIENMVLYTTLTAEYALSFVHFEESPATADTGTQPEL